MANLLFVLTYLFFQFLEFIERVIVNFLSKLSRFDVPLSFILHFEFLRSCLQRFLHFERRFQFDELLNFQHFLGLVIVEQRHLEDD